MRKRTWDTERAKRLLEEGHTNAEVAEMVGVTLHTIACFKSEAGLVVPRKKKQSKKDTEERYTTEEVAKMATEARSKGLTYGELVASRESRVEVEIPDHLTACANRSVEKAAVTPAQAQELEREVFEEDSSAEVNLHFVLNDEEVYLRASSANRAAEILKNLAWIVDQGGAIK